MVERPANAPNTAKHLWILKPMWTTFKTMLRTTINRPHTIQYPDEIENLPANYRGRPGLRFDKCIGCGKCSRICPTTCIEMVEVDDPELGKVKRPQIFLGRCMMCGYCAEYCPTDAMIVTREFELSSFTREGLMFDPYELAWPDYEPGNEVHLDEVLISDLEKGIADPEAKSPWDRDYVAYDNDVCIGCGKCAKNCPTNCIEMVEVGTNAKGKPIKRPKIVAEDCVVCETCIDGCPKDCMYIEEVL